MAIHGHTKIELRDVHTGAVEVVEKDNFVTNALEEWLKPVGIFSLPYGAWYTKGIARYYGALALFDTPVQGDENTFYPAAENHPVGYADYGFANATAATWLGNYNAAESFIDVRNKTATFVYDFATSQANGEIASVCLMPRGCGLNAVFGIFEKGAVLVPASTSDYGITVTSATDGLAVKLPIKFCPITPATASSDWSYYYSAVSYNLDTDTSVFYNSDRKEISRWKMGANRASLFQDAAQGWERLSAATVTLPTDAGSIIQVGIHRRVSVYPYDDDHTCVFYRAQSGSANAGYDYTYTMVVFENETGAQSKRVSFTVHGSTVSGSNAAFYVQGYILIAEGPDHRWLRVSEENPTDIQEAKCYFPQGYTQSNYLSLGYVKSGIVYLTSGDQDTLGTNRQSNVVNWRIEENTVTKTNGVFGTYYQYVYEVLEMRESALMRGIAQCRAFSSRHSSGIDESKLVRLRVFLSTINNLSETVMKTADKTMKITYTLQEVADVDEDEGAGETV